MIELPTFVPDPIDPNSLNIQFSLEFLCESGKFSRKKFEKNNKNGIIKFQKKLEELTKFSVMQFRNSSSTRLKPIKGTQIRSFPKELSPDTIDNEQIYEFRISHKFRVMGYLNKNIFLICWLDPNHEITD